MAVVTTALIQSHLDELSALIGARPTGSSANQRAAAYIRQAMLDVGLAIEEQRFPCLAWYDQGSRVACGGQTYPAVTNPFSPACELTAPLVAAGSLAELMALDLRNQIVLLHGELSAEPYFPKHFPFITFEQQLQVIHQVEEGQCGAIIAVSPRAAECEPIFEDGDFLLPSVTVAADVGVQLLRHQRGLTTLQIKSRVQPSEGMNVIGRRAGQGARRVICCAHFDTKPTTPGAIDNAAGVATILALAQLLQGSQPLPPLEFIAFNGEDYYAASGQVAYLAHDQQTFADIALVINVDGVGVRGAKSSVALFACPDPLAARVRQTMTNHASLVEVEPWPQGDHTLFWPQGVPALAVTSQGIHGLIGHVLHTPHDTVDLVSAEQIATVVNFVQALILSIDGQQK